MRDLPEGFQYLEDGVGADPEAALLAEVRTLSFKNFEFRGYTGLRRTVSFGWRHDFGDAWLPPAPPIPDFLVAPGAPIGWHRDRPVFDQVLGFSVGSACNFRVWLTRQPRSAYILDGPARWVWEHSIPPVEKEWFSITIRNLRERGRRG